MMVCAASWRVCALRRPGSRTRGQSGLQHPEHMLRPWAVATAATGRTFGTGQPTPIALLLAAEAQLAALPEAAQARSDFEAGELGSALLAQQRVVDIFAAVPDPMLNMLVVRQLALVRGLLGEYDAERSLREDVARHAGKLSPTVADHASIAAAFERSVSALRAGHVAESATAAQTAVDGVDKVRLGSCAVALCHGWRGVVTACNYGPGQALEQLQAALDALDAGQTGLLSPVATELWLQQGNVHAAVGSIADAEVAFRRAATSRDGHDAGGDAAGLAAPDRPITAQLATALAQLKLGDAIVQAVETEAKQCLDQQAGGDISSGDTSVGAKNEVNGKRQLAEMQDELVQAEDFLSRGIRGLKVALGEDSAWVGAGSRRLGTLWAIRGDAIMAEAIYGGAATRLSQSRSDRGLCMLRAEHAALLEASAALTQRLSWNGQQRTAEAAQISAAASKLLQGLPAAPAAVAQPLVIGRDEGGAARETSHLKLCPLDWMLLGWRGDQWSMGSAWSGIFDD